MDRSQQYGGDSKAWQDMRAAFDSISPATDAPAQQPAAPDSPKVDELANKAYSAVQKKTPALLSPTTRQRALSISVVPRTTTSDVNQAGSGLRPMAPRPRAASMVDSVAGKQHTQGMVGQIQKSPMLAYALATLLPDYNPASPLPSPQQVASQVGGGITGMTHYCGQELGSVSTTYREVSAELQQCVEQFESGRFAGPSMLFAEHQQLTQLEHVVANMPEDAPERPEAEQRLHQARAAFEGKAEAFDAAKEMVRREVAPAVSRVLAAVSPELGQAHFQKMSAPLQNALRKEPRMVELLEGQLKGTRETGQADLRGEDGAATLGSMLADAAVTMCTPGEGIAGGEQMILMAEHAVKHIHEELIDEKLDARTLRQVGQLIQEGKAMRNKPIQAMKPFEARLKPLRQQHAAAKARLKQHPLDSAKEMARLTQEMKPHEEAKKQISQHFSADLKAADEADKQADELEAKVQAFDSKAASRLGAVFNPCLARIHSYLESVILEGAPMNGRCGSGDNWMRACEQLCEVVNTHPQKAALCELLTGSRSDASPQALGRAMLSMVESGIVSGAEKWAGEDGGKLQLIQFALANFEPMLAGAFDRMESNLQPAVRSADAAIIEDAAMHRAQFGRVRPGELPNFESPRLQELRAEKKSVENSSNYWNLRDNVGSAQDTVMHAAEAVRQTSQNLKSAESGDDQKRVADLQAKLGVQREALDKAVAKEKQIQAKFDRAQRAIDAVDGRLDTEQAHCEAVTQLARVALIFRQNYKPGRLQDF